MRCCLGGCNGPSLNGSQWYGVLYDVTHDTCMMLRTTPTQDNEFECDAAFRGAMVFSYTAAATTGDHEPVALGFLEGLGPVLLATVSMADKATASKYSLVPSTAKNTKYRGGMY